MVSFIAVFVLACPAGAQTGIDGTWRCRYMFTDITANVKSSNGNLSGLVIVYGTGNKATYHFTGTIKGNSILAFHDGDYAFRGHLTSDERIAGTLTTNKGVTMRLTMTRGLGRRSKAKTITHDRASR